MAQKSKMQLIKDELKRIETEFHVLTPEAIVEAAKDPKSLLYGCFEWDNDQAAEKYRLHQARQLVNYYYSKVEGVNIPAWESVTVTVSGVETKGYVSAEKILDSEDLKAQVRAMALQEALTFKNKYKVYKETREVIDEEALADLERMVNQNKGL